MKFSVPVSFDSANRRKDRSVRLAFTTNLEIPTEEFMVMDSLTNFTGHLVFSTSNIDPSDIPSDPVESDTTKPSKRLRNTLYVLWKQRGSIGDFEIFYRRQMERFIEVVKNELED